MPESDFSVLFRRLQALLTTLIFVYFILITVLKFVAYNTEDDSVWWEIVHEVFVW